MDNSVSPPEVQKPEERIKAIETNTLNLLIGGSTGAGVILLAFFLLNYLNIISLSSIYPNQFGWLPHKTEKSVNKLLVSVGKEKIYENDVRKEAEKQYLPSAINNEVLKLFLNKTIEEKIIDQEANKSHITVDDKDIQAPSLQLKEQKRIGTSEQL